MRYVIVAAAIVATTLPATACENATASDELAARVAAGINHVAALTIRASGFFCPCAEQKTDTFMTPYGPANEVVCTTPESAHDVPVAGHVSYWIVRSEDGVATRVIVAPTN